MKTRRKRKRTGFWAKQSLLISLGVVAVLLLTASAFAFKAYVAYGERLVYAKRWESADDQFSRRALGVAQSSYESIAQTDAASCGIEEARRVNELARLMAELCKSLDAEDLTTIVECVGQLQQSPETLGFLPADMTALSRDERVDEVTKWAIESARKARNDLESLINVTQPESLDVARDLVANRAATSITAARESVSRWVAHADQLGVNPARLSRSLGDAAGSEAFHDELSLLLEKCDKAVGDLKEPDLAAARYQWESLERDYPQFTSEKLWSDYSERLRETMRQRISMQPNSSAAALQIPGDRLPDGPVRLDINGIVALPASAAVVNPDLVFARAHELCFALDAKTGSAQWVIDVGYDARWLPEVVEHGTDRLVVCTWKRNRQDVVSVLDAADGTHLWTLSLASSTRLAGPPVVFRSKINLLLTQGELWTLDILDGRPMSRLTLPENTSSPMAVREDGRGTLVMGDKLGVYLVELAGQPKINDVVFPPKTPNTLSSRGMWIPPFAVIFQNELTDTSRMLVYRQQRDEYFFLQSSALPGRVWDSPAVNGADFLIVTDAVSESIQHVDVEAPVDPVTTRFTRLTKSEYPLRPFFISHHDAPFISMQGSTVACYWLDPLIKASDRKPKIRWEHEFPDPKFIPIQELQIRDNRVIVAAQSPTRRSVLVRALRIDSGDQVWSAELGGEITHALSSGRSAMLRTDAGQLVHVSVDNDGDWTRRVLELPPTDDRFDWIDKASSIVRVADSPPRLQAVNYSGAVVAEQPIVNFPISPISVHVGELGFTNDDAVKLSGVWCQLVDAQQRFQLMPLEKASQQYSFVYHQFESVPVDGWMRPIWLDDNAILVAHPSGVLARVDLRREAGVLFLKRTDRHDQMSSPLTAPPIDSGDAIWIATKDSRVRRLNRQTLRTEVSIKLPASPSTELSIIERRLLVGLQDGKVALISTSGRPKLDHVEQVCSGALTLAVKTSKGVLMVDGDGKVHSVDANGKVSGQPIVAPPIAVPPIELAGQLFVATTSGVWRPLTKSITNPKAAP